MVVDGCTGVGRDAANPIDFARPLENEVSSRVFQHAIYAAPTAGCIATGQRGDHLPVPKYRLGDGSRHEGTYLVQVYPWRRTVGFAVRIGRVQQRLGVKAFSESDAALNSADRPESHEGQTDRSGVLANHRNTKAAKLPPGLYVVTQGEGSGRRCPKRMEPQPDGVHIDGAEPFHQDCSLSRIDERARWKRQRVEDGCLREASAIEFRPKVPGDRSIGAEELIAGSSQQVGWCQHSAETEICNGGRDRSRKISSNLAPQFRRRGVRETPPGQSIQSRPY
jgi:hypothetical protein